MSKYKQRGPYHFVEYADPNTEYHAHANDLIEQVCKVTMDMPNRLLDATGLTEPSIHLHEVGCGEGLLLHLLQWKLDRFKRLSGNDADPLAVRMGKLLVPCADITLADDFPRRHPNLFFDIVMFADSLEHISNWGEHLCWAATRSRCVVVAVPSKHDRHAIRDFDAASLDAHFGPDWSLVHQGMRHSRYLRIWRRHED